MDLYSLNDTLTSWLAATDRSLDDDALNDLTHEVASAIDVVLIRHGVAPLFASI